MKTQSKLMLLVCLMVLAASSAAYAESGEGNAVVNGIGNLLKMPVTMLHKASDSLDGAAKSSSGGEDVSVSDVYDLDAETTG